MKAGYQINSNITMLSAQTQSQKPAAAVIQGVKLLTLPFLDMNSYLAEATLDNPFLELNEQLDTPAPHRLPCDPGDSGGMEAYRPCSTASQEDSNDLFNLCGVQFGPDTLNGSLELQLSLCRLTPCEHAIGQDILGNLDERGYFTGNLDSICRFYQAEPEVGKRVLRCIQGFTPRGIAARDVFECLCLQIEDDEPFANLTKRIITEDLESLSKNRVSKCARKYRLDEDSILDIFSRIRSLNPRPGNQSIEHISVCYIIPDIVVKKDGDGFRVFVHGETDSTLRLSEEYLHVLANGKLSGRDEEYMRTKLNEAKMLMKSVSIRQQTIRKFALALLRLQSDFFEKGEEHLRPMTMQKIADEMGVNVSTVSRVVQGKYIGAPWGMYTLKYFFIRGYNCKQRGVEAELSIHHIKRRIKALICEENAADPISDAQICTLLQEDGYQISRRAITKYRQSMGLASQVKRKR